MSTGFSFDGVAPGAASATPSGARAVDLEQALGTAAPSEDLRVRMRANALRSTYYLATAVCQMPDLKPDLHGTMAAWIDRESRFKLGLAARGHLKSHLWTIAKNLRRVTADPNLRVLISNETDDNVVKFLSVMQSVVLGPIYRWLWPDLVPDLRARDVKWNANKLTLRRPFPHPQATIEGIAIGGASTSNHYNIIHNDDPIGRKARDSATVMEDAINHRQLCWSLMVNPARDEINDVGTRWAARDYAQWVLDTVDPLDYFCLSIWHPETGAAIWPERFPPEVIAQLRREQGPEMFALQYENRVLARGATEWDPRHLRRWEWRTSPDGAQCVVLDRPEAEGGKRWVRLSDISTYQVIDAGLSKESTHARTANIVVGLVARDDPTDPLFDIILLDAVASKNDPHRTVFEAKEVYDRWQPIVCAVEVFGGHITFFHWMAREFPGMRIMALKQDSHKPKLARIREIYPFIAAGRFYIHPGQHDFLEEYIAFPNGATVDLLDSLAWAPTVWAPPERPRGAGEVDRFWADDAAWVAQQRGQLLDAQGRPIATGRLASTGY